MTAGNQTTGELYVISAPSGAGKTSLINSLLETFPDLAFSVSATTRAPRHGEVDGVHYHFIDRAEFQCRIDRGRFLESAEVFGNSYGTDRAHVQALWDQGKDVLLEIDVQGAARIRSSHPAACRIFILPPSAETLRQRLHDRGLDQPETIARRLAEARGEIAHCTEFDWIVINDAFDQARSELAAIVTAWPLRRERQQSRHERLIAELLDTGAGQTTIGD